MPSKPLSSGTGPDLTLSEISRNVSIEFDLTILIFPFCSTTYIELLSGWNVTRIGRSKSLATSFKEIPRLLFANINEIKQSNSALYFT